MTPVKYECDSKNLMYFCRIENFVYGGEINERSFSNSHPMLVIGITMANLRVWNLSFTRQIGVLPIGYGTQAWRGKKYH